MVGAFRFSSAFLLLSSVATAALSGDINLVNYGLFNESMLDARWGAIPMGPNQDMRIQDCGCLLTAFSTIIHYPNIIGRPVFGRSQPWYPTNLLFNIQEFSFNPRYLDMFLKLGPFIPPLPPPAPQLDFAWGYVTPQPPVSCGTNPKLGSLEEVAKPVTVSGNGGIIFQTPTGITFREITNPKFDKALIDRNLLALRPTIVGISTPRRPGATVDEGHVNIIAGWDATNQKYLVLDPVWPSGWPPTIPPNYSDWESRITSTIDVDVTGTIGNWVQLYDVVPYRPFSQLRSVLSPDVAMAGDSVPQVASAPTTVEMLVIDPDGRRTGFDPASNQVFYETEGGSYGSWPSWADPLGISQPAPPRKMLGIREPRPGTYRFVITGIESGPVSLNLEAGAGGAQTLLSAIDATVSTGQTLKYEARYAPIGGSTVAAVSNFSPRARAGSDIGGLLATPIPFSGDRSWDYDSAIASYAWNFGDGATATGSRVTHSYSTPGAYTVKLTVTDTQGASDTDTITAFIAGASQSGNKTQRASVSTGGLQGNADSGVQGRAFQAPGDVSISSDGRFVAFTSRASNLVANDTNGMLDVFVYDRQTGVTERVSVSSQGPEGNGDSLMPVLSSDGRFVVFMSYADNLVANDFNGVSDIFVRDRQTQVTERVSVSAQGIEGNGISASTAVSGDGRFVAFASSANNLVSADANGAPDIFVRDRQNGTIERIPAATGETATGPFFPALSADGRFVAFASGDHLLPEDDDFNDDVYVYDRQTRVLQLASVSATGQQYDFDISQFDMSADGRVVVFRSLRDPAGTLFDIRQSKYGLLARDLQARTTSMVSGSIASMESNFPERPSLSSDGRFVAAYLNGGQTGVFGDILHIVVFDRLTNTTEQVSVSSTGQPSNYYDRTGRINADGTFVAFASLSANLVAGDTNGYWDVFVRDRRITTPGSSLAASPSGPYLGWATSQARPSFITFDGSRSAGGSGAALKGKWDFGDGTPQVTVDSVAAPVSHSYDKPGRYTVALIVTDGTSESAPVKTIVDVFTAVAPDSVYLTPTCGQAGATLEVSGIATGPNAILLQGGKNLSAGSVTLQPVSASWLASSMEIVPQMPDFSYRASVSVPAAAPAGNYIFSISGQQARFGIPCASPSNSPPVADAGGPYRGVTGSPVIFDGSKSSDLERSPLTYGWYFGDNTTGAGVSPQHTYSAAGEYLVALIVNDGSQPSYLTVGSRGFARVTIQKPVCTMSGFFAPVSMSAPSTIVWNTVKAGSTVPLKFRCFDGATELTNIDLFEQPLGYQLVGCTAGTQSNVGELAATGATTLRYDASSGQFIYNWQTPAAAGSCYRATVRGKDGGSLSAYFSLK